MHYTQLKAVRAFLLCCSVIAWAAAIVLALVTIGRPHYWSLYISFPVGAFGLTWLWSILRGRQ